MQIINLDIGVRNALKAYLCESGAVREQEALERIDAKLEEAVAFVNQKLSESTSRLFEVKHQEAMKALKVWAKTNV